MIREWAYSEIFVKAIMRKPVIMPVNVMTKQLTNINVYTNFDMIFVRKQIGSAMNMII